MPVAVINSFEQFNNAINSGKPVVVDFWADWCGPCKMISPYFEKFSEGYDEDEITFYKVDVDDQEDVAAVVGVRAMPTFIAFKDGKKVKDVVGANPLKLKELVKYAASLATPEQRH